MVRRRRDEEIGASDGAEQALHFTLRSVCALSVAVPCRRCAVLLPPFLWNATPFEKQTDGALPTRLLSRLRNLNPTPISCCKITIWRKGPLISAPHSSDAWLASHPALASDGPSFHPTTSKTLTSIMLMTATLPLIDRYSSRSSFFTVSRSPSTLNSQLEPQPSDSP